MGRTTRNVTRAARTLKLVLAYEGTNYAGWQTQRRAKTHGKADPPTIQQTVEGALTQILQEPVHLVASGRTDAGVHAEAQVAHLRTRSQLPARRLLAGVNHLLPEDIRVLAIDEAPARFHARFSPSRKRYLYRIYLGAVVPPFLRRYVSQHRGPALATGTMRREAASLAGRHDFRAFARAKSGRQGTVRTITAIRLTRRGQELQLEVEGNGFLHTMVRSIAGTLIDVGRGRRPAGTVRRMLTSGDRRLAGTTAPAQGLTLLSVTYGGGHG